MPESFHSRDFSQGWCPSDDPVNGRINGFQQMENLSISKNGAIYNVGAKVSRQSIAATAHSIFNTKSSGTDIIYSCLTNGTIYRNGTSIATGGSTTKGCFSLAFDSTLICSGAKRIKDNGTTASNLGIGKPATPPVLTPQFYVTNSLTSPTIEATEDGGATLSVVSGQLKFTAAHSFDGSTTFGIVQCIAAAGTNTNQSVLKVPSTTLTAPIADDDTIQVIIKKNSGDAFSMLDNVTAVIITLQDGIGNTISYVTWSTLVNNDINGQPLPGSINFVKKTQVVITVDRNTIQVSQNFDWKTVSAIGVIINTDNSADYIFDVWIDDHFTGGPWDPATQHNNIEYMQVNIANTGSYVGRSEMGPSTGFQYTNGNTFSILPEAPTDAQVTDVQIYRRGNTVSDWRLVLSFHGSGEWTVGKIDGMTDFDALLSTGFDVTLISTASIEDILDIVGPFEGRWFYFTKHYVYPSDIINPDLVNGASEVVKLTAGNSEGFLWAKAVNPNTILVGTDSNIYVLQGTFATRIDGTIDIFYAPLNVKFPPINRRAEYHNGLVWYLASDGWRSISIDGSNQIYTVPSLERMYQNQVCAGYAAVTFTDSPIVIADNKLWGCTNNGIHVYDFSRSSWRMEQPGVAITAACSSVAGNPLVAIGTAIFELNRYNTTSSTTITLATIQLDFSAPKNRKDIYTLRLRMSGAGTVIPNYQLDQGSVVVTPTLTLTANSTEYFIDIADPLFFDSTPCKLFQLILTGTITVFTLEYFSIDYDLRPTPLTFLRIPATNYGSYAYKRLAGQPFELDTYGQSVSITAYLDGSSVGGQNVSTNRKGTVIYNYILNTSELPEAIDYEYIIHAQAGNQFEFYGVLPPRNIETFPELRISHVIPTWNGGNALKKRMRVWPIEINSRFADVYWTPIVDGTPLTALKAEITGSSQKRTVLLHFPIDAIGIDFSAYLEDFSKVIPWEMWNVLPPEIVQVFPIAKRFDQLGPADLSSFGKITKFELRILSHGTTIPWKIYTQDSEIIEGSLSTIPEIEHSYEVNVPKGTNGKIIRMELGPTAFDFHRYYIRMLVAKSRVESENTWITIPEEQ